MGLREWSLNPKYCSLVGSFREAAWSSPCGFFYSPYQGQLLQEVERRRERKSPRSNYWLHIICPDLPFYRDRVGLAAVRLHVCFFMGQSCFFCALLGRLDISMRLCIERKFSFLFSRALTNTPCQEALARPHEMRLEQALKKQLQPAGSKQC